jgi:hypothetical protein
MLLYEVKLLRMRALLSLYSESNTLTMRISQGTQGTLSTTVIPVVDHTIPN